MARLPRFFVSGQPLHIIQRGNNHARIFRHRTDYRLFLEYLRKASRLHGVLVHAYVLMTNHVHLLATPVNEDSVPKALQSVGRRYVQRFNWTYGRSGTLWEGRYRACPIDSDKYLFTCMRYIELNPVRAGLVRQPHDYAWSSYRANALGAPNSLVTSHALYESLAPTSPERQAAYRGMFDVALPDADLEALRESTNKNWALGDDAFKREVEAGARRRASPMPKGRPKIKDLENRV